MTDTHIKIHAVTPRVQYTGNGSTTTFPYAFAIFDEDNLEVYIGDTLQKTGYTVTGVGEDDGGNVIFDTAPDDGVVITIYRNVPIERITDFQEGGAFRPKNINDEFDRQTAFCQQIQEGIGRCLQLDVTSQITPSLILPQVERIYDSIDNIDAVADNETNINTVAGDLTNIDTVAGDKANIDTVAGNTANINTVAAANTNIGTVVTNISDINTCGTNISAIQDAPNQAQAAADSAALAAQYGNDKINQTHISNCITEIPQDIKLVLSDGTLTLKAGSKVYVPNGVGVFDVYTSTSDKTTTYAEVNGTFAAFLNQNKNIDIVETRFAYSGASQPTGINQYSAWYDTTNNIVKKTGDGGSTWTNGYSLPICIFTVSNNVLSSIDQVFNGYGYIGSTVFALPGVKGLIPNGKNADGTLKNTEFVLNSVTTETNSYSGSRCIVLRSNATIGTPSESTMSYDEENNFVTYNNDNVSNTIVGKLTRTSGVISDFNPQTVFHALDYNDKGIIAGFGMPSDKYENLTLGASGTTYTAPANGYFHLQKVAGSSGKQIALFGIVNDVCIAQASGNLLGANIPVSKGETITVSYDATGTTNYFRFVYAKGEE